MFRTLLALPIFLALSPTAHAQDAPGLGGPVIPGLCLLSREAIYANAAAGKAATARLKQLADQVQTEIADARRPIDVDIKAFQTEAAKLTPEQRRVRDEALAARLQPLQTTAQLRAREIEATRVKAMQRIADEAQPIIAGAYQQKRCGLLVDRNSVLGGNLANDLTAEVVRGLDTKLPSFTFDRETLSTAAPIRR